MDYVEIPTNRPGVYAIVDAEDEPLVARFRWYVKPADDRMYVQANVVTACGRVPVLMHRLLCPSSEHIDHRNGDGLDNRRSCNLREATHTQNMRNRKRHKNNTSGFKGVSWGGRREPGWVARICVDNRRRHLGKHATPEDAARAYDEAAITYHGEFARLNFPLDLERVA